MEQERRRADSACLPRIDAAQARDPVSPHTTYARRRYRPDL